MSHVILNFQRLGTISKSPYKREILKFSWEGEHKKSMIKIAKCKDKNENWSRNNTK